MSYADVETEVYIYLKSFAQGNTGFKLRPVALQLE